jgi:hypothetical protein
MNVSSVSTFDHSVSFSDVPRVVLAPVKSSDPCEDCSARQDPLDPNDLADFLSFADAALPRSSSSSSSSPFSSSQSSP